MTSPQDPGQPWMQDSSQSPPSDPTAYSAPPTYPTQPAYPPQPTSVPTGGYTAPGYAAPGYPTGYPPPAGYGYPMYAPSPPTNTLAIIALVLAFVFAPAAIVCGHIARKQIRTSGESGDGLALAGMICGYVFTGIYVVFCGIYVVLIASVFSAGDTGDVMRLLSYM